MLKYFERPTKDGYIRDAPVCRTYCEKWFEACKNDMTCVEDWLGGEETRIWPDKITSIQYLIHRGIKGEISSSFSKKVKFRWFQSFLWGHWYPCFGLLMTSALGFKPGWIPLAASTNIGGSRTQDRACRWITACDKMGTLPTELSQLDF